MADSKTIFLAKFDKNIYKIFVLLILGNLILITFLHNHYLKKTESKKSQLLNQHFEKIINISNNKIDDIILKFPNNNYKKNINISNHSIVICVENKCENYDLFKFGALLNSYIPSYIHYKVELNEHLLYSNQKMQSYELEKKSHRKDDLQLNVCLSIDPSYWQQVEKEIKEPFWELSILIISNQVLLCLLYFALKAQVIKVFKSHYQKEYQNKSEILENNYNSSLKTLETTFMNKMWDYDFIKQKDLEINYLLAQKALEIGFLDQNEVNEHSAKYLHINSPCSIILYERNAREEINIAKLRTLFCERFSTDEEKVFILYPNGLTKIYFSSQAAFFQVLYSIISYLFFIMKKYSPAAIHEIYINIDVKDGKLQLRFEYEGGSIETEDDLFKLSSAFFKSHVNPYLLNIKQVCYLLRENNFDFNITANKSNIIDIIEDNKSKMHNREKEDNIISIKSAIKKKK